MSADEHVRSLERRVADLERVLTKVQSQVQCTEIELKSGLSALPTQMDANFYRRFMETVSLLALLFSAASVVRNNPAAAVLLAALSVLWWWELQKMKV